MINERLGAQQDGILHGCDLVNPAVLRGLTLVYMFCPVLVKRNDIIKHLCTTSVHVSLVLFQFSSEVEEHDGNATQIELQWKRDWICLRPWSIELRG